MKLPGRILTMLVVASFHLATPAFALDPDRSISQYKHTRWTVDEGAPSVIGALTQGADGYLWIGGAEGVYRFDGLRFERFPPANGDGSRGSVSALLAAQDGTVWAGYSKGGLSVLKHGVLRNLREPVFTSYVMSLTQTSDGAIWVALGRPDSPFLRYDGRRWQEVGANWGLPREYLISVLSTRGGALWVSTVQSVMVLPPGAQRFVRYAVTPRGHAALSEDAAGRVWMSDDDGSRVISPERRPGVRFATPGSAREALTLFDRDQNLWGLVSGKGIFRLSGVPGKPGPDGQISRRMERYRARDGLTSDQVDALLEDREGNLWIGSTRGLDRFRAANVVVEPELIHPPMYGHVVLGASDGAVFVGEADAIFQILPGQRPVKLIERVGGTEAICEGPAGEIWMITRDRLLRLRRGRLSSTPWQHSTLAGSIYDCLVDEANVLWANAGAEGLHRYRDGKWDHPVQPSAGGFRPEQLIANRDHKRLAYLGSGAIIEFDASGRATREIVQADARRTMTTVTQGRSGLLVGDASGIGRARGGKLQTLSAARFPWARQPTGIVQTPAGQTWLFGQGRIVGLRTAELEAAFNDPKTAPQTLLLSSPDGLPDIDVRSGVRTAALGGDGRVWFVTVAGMAWVDPARLARNMLPPRVTINRVATPRASYIDPSALELPKGTSNIEIEYTALSLSVPERVRFRYRLQGVDRGWVDPGGRRIASYGNLGPGNYRFDVIASNNDGVWNTKGATVAFSIAPTFLQSTWFLLLCAAAGLLALWGLYTFRTRQLTARVRERLGAQLGERERIARELHDTLLQGFHGLVLRFQAVANRMPPDSALKSSINDALEQAEAVLTEGRNRVSDLRFADDDPDLAQAIVAAAAKLGADTGPPLTVTIEGRVRGLDAMVREELIRIAEEGVRNAIQHSGASRIEVVVVYDRQLQLGVKDDGSGLPKDVAETGARAGHFGLIGMRERARRAGGRLTIQSRPLQGTEISVTVPGRLAYSNGRPLHGSARTPAPRG